MVFISVPITTTIYYHVLLLLLCLVVLAAAAAAVVVVVPVAIAANSATVASWSLAAVLLFGAPLALPSHVAAISGGGLDYAGLNLTGQDFSKGKYKAKVTPPPHY